jgi:sugar phosphate isomerase/epimerase
MKTNRRYFLATSGAAGIASACAARGVSADSEQNPIAVFAKHVQALSFDELGRRLNSIGVQGIEATLRRGGQIAPENLASELPRLCEALAKHDQRVIIAASDINQASTESEDYLAQLAKNSVPFLRMSYYHYDFSRPLLPQLERFAKQAAELAEMCKAHRLTALYQNHAGRNYVGAAVWDLRDLLAQVDPQHMAVAFDIRHAALELSQSFQAGYAVIRDKIGAIYVKDFDWVDRQPVNVPLGQGRAKPLFDLIRRDGLIGPLSLHMEYTDHNDAAQTEGSWQAIESDVATLRRWLA